ncbi:MAG: 50S ribosomal protein L24 [Deltaproteobacteria bacterium]|jgi:large subunit ribosomal protein L24|nr:50S ribosomal protein L24 [Deltaproteobacteria bacterium]
MRKKTEFKTDLKTGDRLRVFSGQEKEKIGTLKRFIKTKNRVLVDGVNMGTKHVKPNTQMGEAGGRILRERSIHISNVALICPKCAEPTWIRHEILPPVEEGAKPRKLRICRRCKARIDE